MKYNFFYRKVFILLLLTMSSCNPYGSDVYCTVKHTYDNGIDTINFGEALEFDWDTMYWFPSNISLEEINSIVNINSVWQDVGDRIVFVKGDKIVYYKEYFPYHETPLERICFNPNSVQAIYKDDAVFFIQKFGEKLFILSQIQKTMGCNCITSCDKRNGCLTFDMPNIGLSTMDDTWSCQHNKYSWATYYGAFDAQGRIISCDIWTPQKCISPFLQYKQIIYCDSTLLEEDDVYFSPNMYNTIDGNRPEIVLVGYDHYEKTWRCAYEYAIKDNTGQFYGFHTRFIEKNKADSIVDMWLNTD